MSINKYKKRNVVGNVTRELNEKKNDEKEKVKQSTDRT